MIEGRLILYTHADSSRLRYIAGFILGEVLGFRWELTTIRDNHGNCPVISYSNEHLPGSFNIVPAGLLAENQLYKQSPDISKWNDIPVFFLTPDADLPFDIFSASFFLITRYEEYVGAETDEHGRFCARSSFSSINGFLGIPVVDLWIRKLGMELGRRFPGLKPAASRFSSLFTFDLDQPFLYLGKSFIRSQAGLIRDIILRRGEALKRLAAICSKAGDPWDTFEYITFNLLRSDADSRFFIPLGDHSALDPFSSWNNKSYRKLISKLDLEFATGLHPSYHASVDMSLMAKECQRYRTVTGRAPSASRFHYIRFRLPDSMRLLCEHGISEDYSMGYHDEPGFRAGTSRSFPFFDLNEEKELPLRIFPFQVMDASFRKYMNMSAAASAETIIRFLRSVINAGGTFTSIWHNNMLTDDLEGAGWRNTFEKVIGETA